MSRVPTAALDPLTRVVDEAAQLDPDSDPAAGYVWLITGRAHALEGERNFEPWAEALEGLWDRALERFVDRWGIGRA